MSGKAAAGAEPTCRAFRAAVLPKGRTEKRESGREMRNGFLTLRARAEGWPGASVIVTLKRAGGAGEEEQAVRQSRRTQTQPLAAGWPGECRPEGRGAVSPLDRPEGLSRPMIDGNGVLVAGPVLHNIVPLPSISGRSKASALLSSSTGRSRTAAPLISAFPIVVLPSTPWRERLTYRPLSGACPRPCWTWPIRWRPPAAAPWWPTAPVVCAATGKDSMRTLGPD